MYLYKYVMMWRLERTNALSRHLTCSLVICVESCLRVRQC